jgi:hypothetical protein
VRFFPDDFATPFWRQHLTDTLQGMRESSLLARGDESGRGAARFVWLRTFHAPVVARLELAPEPFLVVKTLRPNEELLERGVPIDTVVASQAGAAIRSVLAVPYPKVEAGKDGSSWLLEHVGDGYRVGERLSSAGLPADFRAAAWRLIELAGPDVVDGPVY